MCLLVVASPNSTPKKKDLDCASCNNPHGFGYAVIAGDKIITGKGMSAKKVIKEFLAVRKQYPSGYAMYHARFATHGVKNEENCHPFKVGNREDTYLAHNGVLDVDIEIGDKRSDTRIFAEDMLPAMGGVPMLDNDNALKIISKWASGNKIAIFTLDPAAKYDCYIINEDSGHWDNEGMWWSNSTYTKSWASYWDETSPTTATTRPYDYPEDNPYECPSCKINNYEEANPYYCESCMYCYDCSGAYGDSCLCYVPASAFHQKKMWVMENPINQSKGFDNAQFPY